MEQKATFEVFLVLQRVIDQTIQIYNYTCFIHNFIVIERNQPIMHVYQSSTHCKITEKLGFIRMKFVHKIYSQNLNPFDFKRF